SIADLLGKAQAAVDAAADLTELDAVRVQYLGTKGGLTIQLRELGRLPAEARPAAGTEINEASVALGSARAARREVPEARRIEAALGERSLDVTLPGRNREIGTVHPVTRSLRRIVSILGRAGFTVQTGPEVEDDYHNFTALNIPENHPARAMHDTFYLRA